MRLTEYDLKSLMGAFQQGLHQLNTTRIRSVSFVYETDSDELITFGIGWPDGEEEAVDDFDGEDV